MVLTTKTDSCTPLRLWVPFSKSFFYVSDVNLGTYGRIVKLVIC